MLTAVSCSLAAVSSANSCLRSITKTSIVCSTSSGRYRFLLRKFTQQVNGWQQAASPASHKVLHHKEHSLQADMKAYGCCTCACCLRIGCNPDCVLSWRAQAAAMAFEGYFSTHPCTACWCLRTACCSGVCSDVKSKFCKTTNTGQ